MQRVVAGVAAQPVVVVSAAQRYVFARRFVFAVFVFARRRLDDGAFHVVAAAGNANLAAAFNVNDGQIALFADGIRHVGRQPYRVAFGSVERMNHVHVAGRHVPQAEREGIAAVAAVQVVASGAADQFIVAVAAMQRVVSAAAFQRVVSAAAVQFIVAVAADQRFVAVAAAQFAVAGDRLHDGAFHVGAVGAFNANLAAAVNVNDGQIALFADGIRHVGRQPYRVAFGSVERMNHVHGAGRHVPKAEREDVAAVAAVQGVASGAADQFIVASVAAQDVAAVAAPQGVVACLPFQEVVIRAAQQPIVAVAAQQPIVAGAAFGPVVFPAAPQRIVAGPTAKVIASARALDEIRLRRSRQRVVFMRSVQISHLPGSFPKRPKMEARAGRPQAPGAPMISCQRRPCAHMLPRALVLRGFDALHAGAVHARGSRRARSVLRRQNVRSLPARSRTGRPELLGYRGNNVDNCFGSLASILSQSERYS